MSAIEARRSAFATLLACYHNSFANTTEGKAVHSPDFIKRVIEAKADNAVDALSTDPRMTSTDPGAVAVGIARRVMTSESASRSFIDIELGESAFIVSFDKQIKPDAAASVISACGTIAQLCKAGDVIGEGLVSDLTIFAVEPSAPVTESILADEASRLIAESDIEVADGKPRLAEAGRFAKLAKGVHSKALAAYIGRKKYGKKKFESLAAHGKTNETGDKVVGLRLGFAGVVATRDIGKTTVAETGACYVEFRGEKFREDAAAWAKGSEFTKLPGTWIQSIAEDAAIDAALLAEAYTPAFHAEWLKHNTHAVVSHFQGRPNYVSANMPHDEAKEHAKGFEHAEVVGDAEARTIRHHMDTGESWNYVDKKAPAGASVPPPRFTAPVKESAVLDPAKHPLTNEEVKAVYTYAYGEKAWTSLTENAREMAAMAHMMKVFALPKMPGAKNETGRKGFDHDFALALKVMRADKAALVNEEAVDEIALTVHKHFAKDLKAVAEATVLCNGAEKPVVLAESAIATDEGKAELLQGVARCLLLSEGVVPATLESILAKWDAFVTATAK